MTSHCRRKRRSSARSRKRAAAQEVKNRPDAIAQKLPVDPPWEVLRCVLLASVTTVAQALAGLSTPGRSWMTYRRRSARAYPRPATAQEATSALVLR